VTIRRPDRHTVEQRRRELAWTLADAIMRQCREREGWNSAAIAEVRREDERRGAHRA